MTKLTSPNKKRLLIDIFAVRESFRNGNIFDIAHIASQYLADALKKPMNPKMLQNVMATGILRNEINQWIISK